MVGAGFAMIGLSIYALFLVMGDLVQKRPPVLRLLVWAIALPYIANTAGWLLTEVGRFPWVVFGLVRLEDGVSQIVSSGMLWVSLIGYTLVYAVLIFATIYLLRKYARSGPAATDDHPSEASGEPPDEMPSLVGAQD